VPDLFTSPEQAEADRKARGKLLAVLYRRLASHVREMRAGQKLYFRRRSQGDLEAAKSLEREVDRTLKAIEEAERGS